MTNLGGGGWTDERVELLTQLYRADDGPSCSQMAKQINTAFPGGGITRNAVIGKLHRLGLVGTFRQKASAPTRRAPPPPKPPKPRPNNLLATNIVRKAQAAPSPEPLPERIEAPGSATVLTLGAHMCKWPIGDPRDDDFTFCGKRRDGEGPYCRFHAQRAYQAPEQAKRLSGKELARSLRRYL